MKQFIFSVFLLTILLLYGCNYNNPEENRIGADKKTNELIKNNANSVDKIGRELHFISYGDDNFKRSRERIYHEALNANLFKTITIYTPESIPEFIESHRDFIHKNSRGGGYWIWKSYVIQQKLQELGDGEYLFYADAGSSLIEANIQYLPIFLDYIDEGNDILCFQLGHLERDWTKADLFDYVSVDMSSIIATTGQIEAGIQIIKKTPRSVKLIDEWVAIASDYHLIDDSPSYLPNAAAFKEHRHDQSVFSLLVKINGITPLGKYSHGERFIFKASRIHG